MRQPAARPRSSRSWPSPAPHGPRVPTPMVSRKPPTRSKKRRRNTSVASAPTRQTLRRVAVTGWSGHRPIDGAPLSSAHRPPNTSTPGSATSARRMTSSWPSVAQPSSSGNHTTSRPAWRSPTLRACEAPRAGARMRTGARSAAAASTATRRSSGFWSTTITSSPIRQLAAQRRQHAGHLLDAPQGRDHDRHRRHGRYAGRRRGQGLGHRQCPRKTPATRALTSPAAERTRAGSNIPEPGPQRRPRRRRAIAR